MNPFDSTLDVSLDDLRRQLSTSERGLEVRAIDRQFADFLIQGQSPASEAALALWLGAFLCSSHLSHGHTHVCLNTPTAALPDALRRALAPYLPTDIQHWQSLLLNSGHCVAAGERAPLILENNRLYLHRYWHYEQQVNQHLQRLMVEDRPIDRDKLGPLLAALFTPVPAREIDWQQVAVAIALQSRFSILSGGPGTGKTYTVARLLAARLALHPSSHPLRIALAAPTGKAAQRLSESLLLAKQSLQTQAPQLAAPLPTQASTLHRLLGQRRDTLKPRYHAGNPLPCDLLLIDEASMVDLPQLARVLEALPPHADLILVGDKDQLASVEVGNLMGDLCSHANPPNYLAAWAEQLSTQLGQTLEGDGKARLANRIALLRKSRRFAGNSGIGRLSRFVNNGDTQQALKLLKQSQKTTDLDFYPALGDGSERHLDKVLLEWALALHHEVDPQTALERLQRFRVLCATRQGRWGVEHINARARLFVGLRAQLPKHQQHFHGRPIMVTQNDYENALFNGDIGLIWQPDPHLPAQALFEQPGNAYKTLPISRLGTHDSAYAMTIHKSQGSEFHHTALVLNSRDPRMLTRELLYTGLTRAKLRLSIWADERHIRQSVGRPSQRYSALGEKLWSVD